MKDMGEASLFFFLFNSDNLYAYKWIRKKLYSSWLRDQSIGHRRLSVFYSLSPITSASYPVGEEGNWQLDEER